jgi:hypothetical protein
MGNLEHTFGGRLWREIGRQPYTNRKGEHVELIRWRSQCAACSAPIECVTPSAFTTSKAFGLKHCDAHKAPARGAREPSERR